MSLYEAILAKDLERIDRLLRDGADVDEANDEGDTALAVAARVGDEGIVRRLLEAGADAQSKVSATPPLVYAAQRGWAAIASALLSAGADPDVPEEDGTTPLIAAAVGGHLEVVRLLVESGADANAADEDGLTPLRAASLRSEWEVVDVLLPLSSAEDRREAETRRAEFDRRVAERRQEEAGKQSAARKLRERAPVAGTRFSSIRDAVAAGDAVAVGRLLAAGVDVNEPDPETGTTALMLAAGRGDLTLVRHLVEAGASVESADAEHRHVLYFAACAGNLKTVQYLVDAGANPRGMAGKKSALLAAAESGHWEVADFLGPLSFPQDRGRAKTLRRIAGQGLDAESAGRFTAAAAQGDAGAVHRMLAAGFPIDVVDDSGQTALMKAAYHGHLHLVLDLLDRGADPNITDTYGQTALELATGETNVPVFDALWRLAPAPLRKRAMKKVEFNRMLPAQYPAWQNYIPPTIPAPKRAAPSKPPRARPGWFAKAGKGKAVGKDRNNGL